MLALAVVVKAENRVYLPNDVCAPSTCTILCGVEHTRAGRCGNKDAAEESIFSRFTVDPQSIGDE